MPLDEALPLIDNGSSHCGVSQLDGSCRSPNYQQEHRTETKRLKIEGAETASTNRYRTPSPKPFLLAVKYESTPGNLSQLGFDVALSPKVTDRKSRGNGESLYTQAFETTLDTVLYHESFLFSPDEREIFRRYRSMSYEARFLYVRLFLRKRASWFRVNKIGYEGDIRDVISACRELWNPAIELAENEAALNGLDDSIQLLALEELKCLAKDLNCRGSTKERLIDSILKLSKLQLSLQRSGSLGLDFNADGKLERKDNLVLTRVKKLLGQLIRLRDDPVTLFNRLHIVFYRSSEYNEKSLTTLILARISRRTFPRYQVDRASTIFSTRESLLEYEQALKLKFEVDTIMELNTNQTQAGLDRVIEIFENVFEPWQALVMNEQEQDTLATDRTSDRSSQEVSLHKSSKYYSRRFTAGWVWTRLIFKAAAVFAKRHDYSREHQIWSMLLSQKIYRVGRRGEWYDRKALLEQHYAPTMGGTNASEAQKRKSKRLALSTCVTGLQDPDTHQIYHNALQRRIIRLETDLRFVKRERHDFSHITLRKPATRTISGVRLDDRLTGKHSIWRGKEVGSELGVEQLCLETYENEGWRGFHSENSIVTTLFAMLFWDILFMSVPGVFQTEFQTAPLDLATDAFFRSRASEVNHRLALIENGGGPELITLCDAQHRKTETWCVGLNWSYDLQDLLEIAKCIGNGPLARFCKLFAEEYGHRVGGIGDLCLWNPILNECMFVEVKGPGDRLSETQIAWLDQMSIAGIRVELCHVVEDRPVSTGGRSNGTNVKLESKVALKRSESQKSNASVVDFSASLNRSHSVETKVSVTKRENSA